MYESCSAISHKVGLQALYWLETVSKCILAIGENEFFAWFLLCQKISYTISHKYRLQALYWLKT